jgi:uncharacterized protein
MITLYQISIPVFIKHLNGLAGCMKKAQALYAEKKYDEATLLGYRFYPDMFNFAGQVQVATDHTRNFAALLADVKAPRFENHEKSLADLIGRIEQTVGWLKEVDPKQIDGTEDKSVTVKRPTGEVQMKGLELLLNRTMPNFLFHCTTAYDIMRHNGVEIGKRDFMGS